MAIVLFKSMVLIESKTDKMHHALSRHQKNKIQKKLVFHDGKTLT